MKEFSKLIHKVKYHKEHRYSYPHNFKGHHFKAPKEPFYPKLFAVLKKGYGFNDFVNDLIAGLVVGIIAIPLAMACAIASGVNPIHGLNASIVAGVIIGVFGGSRYQISAPIVAFVVIVNDIVFRHGYDGLLLATFMAGIILFIAGLCRLGGLVKYIAYPVITGLTTGIGFIIFTAQFGEFLGISVANLPPDFISRWSAYIGNLSDLNLLTFGLGLFSLTIMLIILKKIPRLSAPVCGVIIATLIVLFFDLPVSTIESRYGIIEGGIPPFQLPDFNFENIRLLLPDAITIALLIGIESLLTCVVADNITGDKHFSNIELLAQGFGNIFCAMFSGLPSTGAMARTATNIANGARSPIASIIQGLIILGCLYWLAPVISLIPLTCLAAVMILTSYGMIEIHAIKKICQGPLPDIIVMIITFLLTILLDLTVAVYAGVLLSSLLFMQSMSQASMVREIEHETVIRDEYNNLIDLKSLPEGVHLFSITGPFFFGMVDRFHYAIEKAKGNINVFVIQMRDMPTIDATGIHVLETFIAQKNIKGYEVILTEVPPLTRRLLKKTNLLKMIGEDNIFHHLTLALQRATELSENRKNENNTSN